MLNRDNLISWEDMFRDLKPAEYSPDVHADISLSNMIDDFSTLLFHYRYENNLTQKQLAEQLDVTQAMVSAYETGSRNLSLKTLSHIAAKIGYSVSIAFSPLPAVAISDTEQHEPSELNALDLLNAA